MDNKYLVAATRYLNTNYDISIDENDPSLSDTIKQYVATLDSLQLEYLWLKYKQEHRG